MATAKLTIRLKDGTSQTLSQQISEGDKNIDYENLQKSLICLRDESNAFLTKLVQEEKSTCNVQAETEKTSPNGKNESENTNVSDDGSEDDEEEDDDDETNSAPPEKRLKT